MDERIKKMEELSDALIKTLSHRFKSEEKLKADIIKYISEINIVINQKADLEEKYRFLIKTLKDLYVLKTEVEADLAQNSNKGPFERKKTIVNEVISYLNTQKANYESAFSLEEGVKTNNKETTLLNNSRVKWKGSPALFGFLFFELARKGYIDFPLRNGEINPTGLAKDLFEIFEISTTQENLIKEMNPHKNSLSDTKRSKFIIPELKDLA